MLGECYIPEGLTSHLGALLASPQHPEVFKVDGSRDELKVQLPCHTYFQPPDALHAGPCSGYPYLPSSVSGVFEYPFSSVPASQAMSLSFGLKGIISTKALHKSNEAPC